MSLRLVLHAGFHKTGTTSAQETLKANRAVLQPHLRVVLRPDMVGLCEAARAYSVSRAAADLAFVQAEAAYVAESWEGTRPVLVSSEDLCGHMPLRRGLQDYSAAPKLLAAMTEVFGAAHPGANMRIVLTTRAAAPWLRSCYVQHLRATDITMNVAEYATAYAASADLMGMAQTIAKSVPCPVDALPLEEIGGHRLGPAAALLTRAAPDLDLSVLRALPPANTAPPQAKIDAMLALNRQALDKTARRAAMQALHRKAW